MIRRSVFERWMGLTAVGALAASWPFSALAQGIGQIVDQTIQNPAGQGIQQAAAAHVINLIITVVYWSGVIGLVALIGLGVYGLVEARGDEDRYEQARGRVRLGAVGLGILLVVGVVGWLLLYR